MPGEGSKIKVELAESAPVFSKNRISEVESSASRHRDTYKFVTPVEGSGD